jgi:hypothetical protein
VFSQKAQETLPDTLVRERELGRGSSDGESTIFTILRGYGGVGGAGIIPHVQS